MSDTEHAVHALIRENGFGPFEHNGREILRRLFVTVRDEAWQETPPKSWISIIDESAHTIRVEARHTTDQLDVEWQGVLTVDNDGLSGRFDLEAMARRTLRVCRLGLVVLHPVDFMVSAKLTAEGPEGSRSLTISRRIAPQPIVRGVPGAMTPSFSRLLIERDGVGRLALEFEGDLFELEDQRNWGDGSFKTYCTPLRLGFPRTIDAGTRIVQRLRWRFTPAPSPKLTRDRPELIAISGIVPSIGHEWSKGPMAAWDHVAIDLRSSERLLSLPHRLDFGSHQKLEIAVSDDLPLSVLEQVCVWIAAQPARVGRLLIYSTVRSLPEGEGIARWRHELTKVNAGHVPMLAASQGYFVEFNRADWKLESVVDGIAFPHTATVHSDDPATIIENVATIRDMAEAARALTPRAILGLAPLALYYPCMQRSRTFPLGLTDAWLAANLLWAAAAGISAVTLDENLAQALSVARFGAVLPWTGSRMTLYVDETRPTLHLAHLIRGDAQRWLAVNLDARPVALQAARLPKSADPVVQEGHRALTREADPSVAPQGVRWFDGH